MIGETVRYYPIYEKLMAMQPQKGSILDVGSKERGIGLIYKNRYVGIDLSFAGKINHLMNPVMGSILHLPFLDNSFEIVVCSDVLEHITEQHRPDSVRELMRVAKKALILGFPSGNNARESDQLIARMYDKKSIVRPSWLVEHLSHGPVSAEMIEKVLLESNPPHMEWIENQSISLGVKISGLETIKPVKAMLTILARLSPYYTGKVLCRYFDKNGPYARRIYTVELNP